MGAAHALDDGANKGAQLGVGGKDAATKNEVILKPGLRAHAMARAAIRRRNGGVEMQIMLSMPKLSGSGRLFP